MKDRTVFTESYFDGIDLHEEGPYSLQIRDGRISEILSGNLPRGEQGRNMKFIMPGLVEGHCHLFLDGGVLDLKQRGRYLKAPLEEMVEVAHLNVKKSIKSGITLTRDAGDRFGVNHIIRKENGKIDVRSSGLALRAPSRYGSFMAREVGTASEIVDAIHEISRESDDLKILQTGIIDFAAGEVKGAPQFNLEELNLIVKTAEAKQLRTFAHCSGTEGIAIAVDANVNSIEHGFFMTRELLLKMAEKEIAWVPTFSPVHFQRNHPEIVGWNQHTVDNLHRILDSHLEHVAIAESYGVPLVAGSDAGSHGVEHGQGLIDELFFLLDAGVSVKSVLQAATSRPRRIWGCASTDLAVGNIVDYIELSGSPFKDPQNLRKVKDCVRFKGVQAPQ